MLAACFNGLLPITDRGQSAEIVKISHQVFPPVPHSNNRHIDRCTIAWSTLHVSFRLSQTRDRPLFQPGALRLLSRKYLSVTQAASLQQTNTPSRHTPIAVQRRTR